MDVEIGTVWSVGKNLAAAKAEPRHLPAFDTSVMENLGNTWRMSESDIFSMLSVSFSCLNLFFSAGMVLDSLHTSDSSPHCYLAIIP